jgi:hypothetical protein
MTPRIGGIKVTKREQQAAFVTECRASGMKAKAWCEAKDIEYRRYVNWAIRQTREDQHEPQQWAEVTIAKEERVASEIRLTCGSWTI